MKSSTVRVRLIGSAARCLQAGRSQIRQAGPMAVATGSREFALFFLACVVVAALYGAWSVNKRIFMVQGVPALAALAALLAG